PCLRCRCSEHQHENIIPGGSIIIWSFAASGTGQLHIIEGKMNSKVYQVLFQDNVRLSQSEPRLQSCRDDQF
uniref:Uncharacterized protein n=1 Tax=Seriola lalandi dorsalis TaxID=1841481 RepID=A0A3B4WCU2_SERLL